jgi:SnoaL-like domain
VETVMGFFTDDIVFFDTTIDHGATGAKQMRRFVQSAFTNMAGTQLEYVSHVATAEGYAVEWVLRPAGVPGISVGTLRDGKISTNRDYWNGARFQIPNT